MPASLALHQCGLKPVSFYSEIADDPLEIISSHWPEAISIGDMRTLDLGWVEGIVKQCPEALIWCTGGIPCQDVSLLNRDRQGSSGERSGLHLQAKKVVDEFLKYTSNVIFTFECTRMDPKDRKSFTESFGVEPIEINNRGFAPLSRPRLWWIGGKAAPSWPDDCLRKTSPEGIVMIKPDTSTVSWKDCILPGYVPCNDFPGNDVCFNCLTLRKKRSGPMSKPAGIKEASSSAITAWKKDYWSQSPYQYEIHNMVMNDQGDMRRLVPCEEEALMGYPRDYTAALKKTADKDQNVYAYRRHSLLGNSWSLFVTTFIVKNFVLPNVVTAVEVQDSPLHFLDEDAYNWGRANCPFLSDKLFMGNDNGGSLPPDIYEMNAHSVGGLAEKVQSRKHTPWHLKQAVALGGTVASLPKGLPQELHFEVGCLVDSPADADQSIPSDLDFAVRTSIEMGSKADAWRRNQFNAMKDWINHADNLKSFWESLKSIPAKEVAPKVNPHAIDLLSHSIRWPDISVAAMMTTGACPLGRQESTGVFRQKLTEAPLSEAMFQAGCQSYMSNLMKRPPPRGDQAKIIFDLSTLEQEAGLLSSWVTKEQLDVKYGAGKWRALPRYAIHQGEKYRLIDNGRAGEHNDTYEATETIHTTCTAAGVALASHYRKIMGKPMLGKDRLQISTQDMWKAYRQIPCHPSQSQFMVVMVWHPWNKEWVFGQTSGLLFGITGAVLHFNRIPALIVALARRWLAIPVQNFFDDFRILDLARSNGSANRFFCLLVEEILGFRIDPKKEQKPDYRGIFLGNVEDYNVAGEEDIMMVAPKPGRKEAIQEFVNEAIKHKCLHPGEAKTLRGRMIHYASTCAGRVGKGILHFINEQASSSPPGWSEGLHFNLLFLLEILQLDIPRKIPLSISQRKKVRVWSDASFHTSSVGVPLCKLCAIIVAPGVAPQGIVTQVPIKLLNAFQERKQQIHMGELLAPFCALIHWGAIFEDSSAIFYIDNMGVLCNIVNGASRQLDAGTVTFALHLRLASLRSSAWWEWVESESNCSDGGSREGVTCPVAKSLGITLREVDFPAIPLDFMRMVPSNWTKFWEEQSINTYT